MNSEERQAKREAQREQIEKWRAEEEQERLAKPLVERLRNSGPFEASDGFMSYATGDYRDAHEAADRIEQLESMIQLIEDWAITDFNEELLAFMRVIKEKE